MKIEIKKKKEEEANVKEERVKKKVKKVMSIFEDWHVSGVSLRGYFFYI